MSVIESHRHREFATEIEREISELEERISELRAVHRYHADRAGLPVDSQRSNGDSRPVKLLAPRALVNGSRPAGNPETKAEAAIRILRESTTPLRIREITEKYLGNSAPDRAAQNAFFTAMDRKKDVFFKTENKEWGLVEWQGKM